jgi:hypothetical protein
MAKSKKRSPESPWLALIGTLDEDMTSRFVIGSERTYVVPDDSNRELVCFANDVPGFYWNNFGYVLLNLISSRLR